MKKTLLIVIAIGGIGSSVGHTRRFRRRSWLHPDKPMRNLGQKVGQKFKRPAPVPEKPLSLKKKILVLTSDGGGGHTSVCKGLSSYLGNTYELKIINSMKTILAPVDTLGTVTFGKVTAEELYNFFLRCGWTNLIGNYSESGHSYMTYRHGSLVKLFRKCILREKPALVISVIPHTNRAYYEVCKEQDIPFLILTNDLDSANYMFGFKPPYYKKFKYAIPFDYPGIHEKIKAAQFTKDQLVITGFPLRPAFFFKKKVAKLKKEWDIPEDKPVVMVFMGGAGSQASYRYVRVLSKLGMPMHIIACLGRNERLKRNIKKILLPHEVTITIMGFTDRIADLMAISDVLITKPGPNSVCEGLQSHVPMILDQTNGTIPWELLNIDFMVDNGFAEPLMQTADLESLLPKYFVDDAYISGVKKNMAAFDGLRFDHMIGPLVENMIALNEQAP